MPVILLALSSMVCAAANDFVFKLYARRHDATGIYLAVIGVLWVSVFMAYLPAPACLLDYNPNFHATRAKFGFHKGKTFFAEMPGPGAGHALHPAHENQPLIGETSSEKPPGAIRWTSTCPERQDVVQ